MLVDEDDVDAAPRQCLRAGAAAAVREFCEFRNLLPRGVKLAPEDVWDGARYVPDPSLLETRRGVFFKASYLWRM